MANIYFWLVLYVLRCLLHGHCSLLLHLVWLMVCFPFFSVHYRWLDGILYTWFVVWGSDWILCCFWCFFLLFRWSVFNLFLFYLFASVLGSDDDLVWLLVILLLWVYRGDECFFLGIVVRVLCSWFRWTPCSWIFLFFIFCVWGGVVLFVSLCLRSCSRVISWVSGWVFFVYWVRFLSLGSETGSSDTVWWGWRCLWGCIWRRLWRSCFCLGLEELWFPGREGRRWERFVGCWDGVLILRYLCNLNGWKVTEE